VHRCPSPWSATESTLRALGLSYKDARQNQNHQFDNSDSCKLRTTNCYTVRRRSSSDEMTCSSIQHSRRIDPNGSVMRSWISSSIHISDKQAFRLTLVFIIEVDRLSSTIWKLLSGYGRLISFSIILPICRNFSGASRKPCAPLPVRTVDIRGASSPN
jgi:hypothetical protein